MIRKSSASLAAVAMLATASGSAAGGRALKCYEPIHRPALYDTVYEDVMVSPGGQVVDYDAPIFGTDVSLQKARTAAFFSGAYAAKLAITGEGYRAGESRNGALLMGLLATIYGLWLVYAAGLSYLFMCAILYAPGIVFYIWARRENRERLFHPVEAVLAAALVAIGLYAAYEMAIGAVSAL